MVMRLEGWNHIPEGYGADFEVAAAPLWLRVLFRTPFLDRFAHPLLVQRGHGFLVPHPTEPPEGRGVVADGWKLRPANYVKPGSVSPLELDS